MILQSLTKLYYDLLKNDKISRPGWAKTKVGFALCLDETGSIYQIVPLVQQVNQGGKEKTVTQTRILPAPVKRASNVASNFLWDNSSYIFGVDDKGKPERSLVCFKSCADLHRTILGNLDNHVAKAILSFFDTWNPAASDENKDFLANKTELLKGSNIVFRVNGVNAEEDPEVSDAWQDHYDRASGSRIQCLITGQEDILETVHPALKGVDGAQSSGAALVSFNAKAFCSYGREQGENAPVGKKAAFAYTSALNYLLADRNNVQHIGDATVVCWAEGAQEQYQSISLAALFGTAAPKGMSEDDLRATVKRLANGLPCAEYGLMPETVFYILGISPNSARLSVRFFYRSSFGDLMKNINNHHERMIIADSKYEYMPLWALLKETVNRNSKDSSPSPVLAGSVARAIFCGSCYPDALLEAVMLRIHAERDITSGRAAIIKAFYLKNINKYCPEEVLTVSLNENSTNVPYTIGRLFAIYEAAQEKANPGINTTIRDKYFNSVAATPSRILPVLNNLYQKHLRKMDKGSQVYFDKQVSELLNILGDELPVRLSLPEQGAFQLGYYHQQKKRYENKN